MAYLAKRLSEAEYKDHHKHRLTLPRHGSVQSFASSRASSVSNLGLENDPVVNEVSVLPVKDVEACFGDCAGRLQSVLGQSHVVDKKVIMEQLIRKSDDRWQFRSLKIDIPHIENFKGTPSNAKVFSATNGRFIMCLQDPVDKTQIVCLVSFAGKVESHKKVANLVLEVTFDRYCTMDKNHTQHPEGSIWLPLPRVGVLRRLWLPDLKQQEELELPQVSKPYLVRLNERRMVVLDVEDSSLYVYHRLNNNALLFMVSDSSLRFLVLPNSQLVVRHHNRSISVWGRKGQCKHEHPELPRLLKDSCKLSYLNQDALNNGFIEEWKDDASCAVYSVKLFLQRLRTRDFSQKTVSNAYSINMHNLQDAI